MNYRKNRLLDQNIPKLMLDGANWSLLILQADEHLLAIAKKYGEHFLQSFWKNYILKQKRSSTKVISLQHNTLNVKTYYLDSISSLYCASRSCLKKRSYFVRYLSIQILVYLFSWPPRGWFLEPQGGTVNKYTSIWILKYLKSN